MSIMTKNHTIDDSRDSSATIWQKRFWASTITSLIIIVAMLVGGTSYIVSIKNNVVSDEDLTTLAMFDEVATPFLKQFEFDREKPTVAEATGHGISEDGDFYISFKYYVQNDDGTYDYNNSKTGKVYFWTDKQDGHRSYGFSYD